MHPALDEFQKRKQQGPAELRSSPSRLTPKNREDSEEGNATEDGQDDLRIMEHFVRGFIEGA